MYFSTIITVPLIITFLSLNGFVQKLHGQIPTVISRINCDFDQNLCNCRNYSNWEFVDYSVITNIPPPKGQRIIALLRGQKHKTAYLVIDKLKFSTAIDKLILWVFLSIEVQFEVTLLSPQKTILWSTKSEFTPNIKLGREWIPIEIDLISKMTQQNKENKTFELPYLSDLVELSHVLLGNASRKIFKPTLYRK
ncbi:uncharacterized protein LOC143239054 [Tachypleus tridentatus]|uniref:uncharacterized protein LOC143239054 n=1 Tax=Tachypleus tridentatus TaxID=6853 RepID=UPI003FD387B5